MEIAVFKTKGNKETIVKNELELVVKAIREGQYRDEVAELRQIYPLIRPTRDDDGRMQTAFSLQFRLELPRLCFAATWQNLKGEPRLTGYNGLVVLEANNLADYDEAIGLRNAAARMPQTLLTFLGASGRSVKIVCRGELFPEQTVAAGQGGADDPQLTAGGNRPVLPVGDEDMRRFHLLLYRTARKAYNAQLDITLEAAEPRLSRIVYMSADPDLTYRPQAMPFYVDLHEDEEELPKPSAGSGKDEGLLMPGRSQKQTWLLNYQFVLTSVMGKWFELPDEERVGMLLMQVAGACLEEGIPQGIAEGLTLEHPVLNADPLLVRKTFENVYAVQNMENYLKSHKLKPMRSVPEDTLLMMKTDIFLQTHYEMRKNVMTGVAQYRELNGYGQEFVDLEQEARNEMTIRAKELGLKSWDKDIERFIESPRIEKYDPVNDWLDHLPRWDGQDRIAALAARVPTSQPHWEHYFHTWLLGMVAHWQGRKSLTGNALVPLLIGEQGCGKSSFCRILLPPELRDYYNDRISFKNETDLNLGLTSFALINIDEFDKTTQRQQVLLKYLLSTADVKFRPPYGKAVKQYRRYASFIGTTNQVKPLSDPTGSRRFVCAEVTGLIDFEDSLDHRQLYAQLKQEVADGQRYWLDDKEIGTLIEENDRFQHIDSLAEMISQLLRVPGKDENGQWYTTSEILGLLQKRYGKATLAGCSLRKIGNVLSARPFNLKPTHRSCGSSYMLAEQK